MTFWPMALTAPNELDERFALVTSFLRRARSVLFVTGAGISADSGLPTYRGVGGLYEVADTPEGLPIEEILSGEMVSRNPALTWHYLHEIESAAHGARFNEAHAFVAEAEKRHERVWVITQNVDGLHRAAGSSRVIDIHGDIHDLRCTVCDFTETVVSFETLAPLPLCPRCNAALRPDVVLFGELLPTAKVWAMEKELAAGFDVVFSVGTTSVFPYIVRPVLEAKRRGAPTVEINPGETVVSDLVDVKLPLGAADAFQSIRKKLYAP